MSRPVGSDSSLGTVFLSYARQDRQWPEQLLAHLFPLRKLIDVWEDSRITPGQNWRDEIRKAVDSASAAVLLASKNYLASDFIVDQELPLLELARARGLTIFVLIISPCRLDGTSLLDIQAVNTPEKTMAEMGQAQQDRLLVGLCAKIEAALLEPITKLRELIATEFMALGKTCDKVRRAVETDPGLCSADSRFLVAVIEGILIESKRRVVMRELANLETGRDRNHGIVQRTSSKAGRYAKQLSHLQEELHELDKEEARAKKTVDAAIRENAVRIGQSWDMDRHRPCH